MVIGSNIVQVARQLKLASRQMPKIWDGRASILEMKNSGSRHWRQMEWMGFYFEFLCERNFGNILKMPGKKYGRVEFDAFCEISWDFKAHTANTSNHRIITNDTEAIGSAIDEHGYYGLILAVGEVEYNDEERTFKQWHDELKGEPSAYVLKNIERGAMSRRRKTEFVLDRIHFICLDEEMLNECSGTFQEGFRNSDGSPRRPKVTVNVQRIPNDAILATERF